MQCGRNRELLETIDSVAGPTRLCRPLCLVWYVLSLHVKYPCAFSSPCIHFQFTGVMTDMSGVNQLDSLMNSDGTPNDLGKWYLGDHSTT